MFSKADCIVVFISKIYMQGKGEILSIERDIAMSPLCLEADKLLVVALDKEFVPEKLKKRGYLSASDYRNEPEVFARIIRGSYENKGNKPVDKSYLSQGNFNCIHRNFKAAIKDYDKAIQLEPDFVNAYNNRDIAKKRQEKTKT